MKMLTAFEIYAAKAFSKDRMRMLVSYNLASVKEVHRVVHWNSVNAVEERDLYFFSPLLSVSGVLQGHKLMTLFFLDILCSTEIG